MSKLHKDRVDIEEYITSFNIAFISNIYPRIVENLKNKEHF